MTLTYTSPFAPEDVRYVDCPICRQAVRVDLYGNRLSVRCAAQCPEDTVLAKLDTETIITELRSNGTGKERSAERPSTNGHKPVSPTGDTAARSTLRRLDVARMIRDEPPAVPWVIEGLVARGMLSVVNGREGEGKSLLAMALGAGVASGQDEGGLVCHKGSVLIVDAENGEGEIHRRVRTLELPSDGVECYEAQGFDLRSNLTELEAILDAHRPDLLVLDSYRSLWGGEENDSREVSAVLDPLRNLVRSYDAGTLLLHHSGKGNGGYRGSSAIGASAELGFKLARLEDDPDPTRCYLQTWKCRPAEQPPKRWMRLAVERGRVFIDAAETPEEEETPRPAPVRNELAPQVLAELSEEPRSRADVARAVGRGPKDRTIGRVLEELLESGQVKVDRGAPGEPDRWHRRGVAAGTAPIGSCHPATPPNIPLSRAENGGWQPSCHPPSLATPEEEAETERTTAKFNGSTAA